MDIMDEFVQWFTERDRHVLASHIKKDKAALTKVLKELEAERDHSRTYHERLEDLLESMRQLQQAVDSQAKGGY